MPQYFLEIIIYFIYIFSSLFILITILRTDDYKDRKAITTDLILSLGFTTIAFIIATRKTDGVLQNKDFYITKIRIICSIVAFLIMLITIAIRLKISKKGK